MEENTRVMLTDGDEAPGVHDGALIDYDWSCDGGVTPEVTEADWDAPAPEEDDADQSGVESGGSFRLKHLGHEFDVTRDEMITLAQKGADYDRIRERADRLAENLRQRDDAAMAMLPAGEQRRERETREFIGVYREVRPEDIPQEVWSEVADGKTLLSAYQGYENRQLRLELEAKRREEQNRQRTTGPRPTLGAVNGRGELEEDWYRD